MEPAQFLVNVGAGQMNTVLQQVRKPLACISIGTASGEREAGRRPAYRTPPVAFARHNFYPKA
jgi:hypothetical protein